MHKKHQKFADKVRDFVFELQEYAQKEGLIFICATYVSDKQNEDDNVVDIFNTNVTPEHLYKALYYFHFSAEDKEDKQSWQSNE